MKNKIINNYLTNEELNEISSLIKAAETKTAGEIVLSINVKSPIVKIKKDLRKLAEKEFFRLGVNKTKEATGILIFLHLKERKFYILADKGINEKVEQGEWNSIRDEMQIMFSKSKYFDGINFGIRSIGEILHKHFPIKPDDTNELPNEVVIN